MEEMTSEPGDKLAMLTKAGGSEGPEGKKEPPNKGHGNRHHKLEEIAAALNKSGGYQSVAAQMLGMSRAGLSARIARTKKLQEILDDMQETLTDMAEMGVAKLIRRGNSEICRWHLIHSKKGKIRGYSERTELTGADGGPMGMKFYDFDASKFPKPGAKPEKKGADSCPEPERLPDLPVPKVEGVDGGH